MTTTLGVTFACFRGFTSQFDIAQIDEQILRDEVFHRLTTDTVLGDSEDAASFGYDVRRRLGARMTDEEIAGLGPLLSSVLQRSGRVDSADVIVTRVATTGPLLSLLIAVSVVAITGETFSFLFKLTGSTFEQVGNSGST